MDEEGEVLGEGEGGEHQVAPEALRNIRDVISQILSGLQLS